MTSGPLTKAALAEHVADVADLTKKRAKVIVETVLGSIAEALRHGEKVEVRGFGSFPPPAPRTAPGPQPEDRRPRGCAVEARRLLQARQGAGGTDQPGARLDGAAAGIQVGRRRTALPSRPWLVRRFSPGDAPGSLCERRVKALHASSAALRP